MCMGQSPGAGYLRAACSPGNSHEPAAQAALPEPLAHQGETTSGQPDQGQQRGEGKREPWASGSGIGWSRLACQPGARFGLRLCTGFNNQCTA